MNDRGVSITLNYVLGLAIATLLITGLLFAGTSFVSDQREDVIRTEMNIVGQQLASELDRGHRLVAAGRSPTTVEISIQFPDRVAGSTYYIELDESQQQVILTSTLEDVTVEVNLANSIPIKDSQAEGGRISITWDRSSDKLVISDAS